MAIKYFGRDEGVSDDTEAAGPLIKRLPKIPGHYWVKPREKPYPDRWFYHLYEDNHDSAVNGWLTRDRSGKGYWVGGYDAEGHFMDVHCDTLQEVREVIAANRVLVRFNG